MSPKWLCTLGMFIIDEFEFLDENAELTGKTLDPQIGGGGTYCVVGARMWLPPQDLGMIIDFGEGFPETIKQVLDTYGSEMWLFRPRTDGVPATRSVNIYRGEQRGTSSFRYTTPKVRITPKDLEDSSLERPKQLHFVCSPERASVIMDEVTSVDGWDPTIIYEPIPDRCVPEQLPELKKVLPKIHILSPNAEEAMGLLSIPLPVAKEKVEEAARGFIGLVRDAVVIRSGEMGAYALRRGSVDGQWVEPYWTQTESDQVKVVDVTGAGNSFLGGLSAGLLLSNGDLSEAMLYASVSASFTIEQLGLPLITSHGEEEKWNEESPRDRLDKFRRRTKDQ